MAGRKKEPSEPVSVMLIGVMSGGARLSEHAVLDITADFAKRLVCCRDAALRTEAAFGLELYAMEFWCNLCRWGSAENYSGTDDWAALPGLPTQRRRFKKQWVPVATDVPTVIVAPEGVLFRARPHKGSKEEEADTEVIPWEMIEVIAKAKTAKKALASLPEAILDDTE